MIMLTKVKKLYTTSPENQKFVIVIKTIIADKKEPLLSFVIAFRKKIINNWIYKKLIRNKIVIVISTDYINNQITL